jgi:polyferredoxin
VLKRLLWAFVTAIFLVDLVKLAMDVSLVEKSLHQHFLTVFLRSTFGLFELIMGGLIIWYAVKHPERRARIASVAFFHYVSVLALPLAFRDFTWMAVLYPWPQTLLAFDPRTTTLVAALSLAVGFVGIPALTLRFGAKGFCGWVCPHGAFYSEAFGRLFTPPPGRLPLLRRFGPPAYFVFMSAALLSILLFPSVTEQVRLAQKLAFFGGSQLLYFIVGIPLVGPRSYCTHLCPIGLEVGWIVRARQSLRRRAVAG